MLNMDRRSFFFDQQRKEKGFTEADDAVSF